MTARGGSQLLAARTRNGLGEVEHGVVFTLAEILRLKQLRQANDMCAASRGIGHPADGFFEILFRLRSARHLDQGDAKFLWGQAQRPPRFNIASRDVSP